MKSTRQRWGLRPSPRKGNQMTTTQSIDNKTISLIASYISAIKVSKSEDSEISMLGFTVLYTLESNLLEAGLTDEQIGLIAKAVR